MQEQILNEKIIQFIGEKQLENGWIGSGFHGSNKNAGQYDNQKVDFIIDNVSGDGKSFHAFTGTFSRSSVKACSLCAAP